MYFICHVPTFDRCIEKLIIYKNNPQNLRTCNVTHSTQHRRLREKSYSTERRSSVHTCQMPLDLVTPSAARSQFKIESTNHPNWIAAQDTSLTRLKVSKS